MLASSPTLGRKLTESKSSEMSTYEALLRKWCFDRGHLRIARCRNAIGQLNYFARDVDLCESVCKVDVVIQIKSRAKIVSSDVFGLE